MSHSSHHSISHALPELVATLKNIGTRSQSRNGFVRELLNPQITLTNPVNREVLNTGRKANVFAQIAETMWVLAGRNDIEWLSAYLPRAKDYSDDGKTWRGGYGPRIRKWGGYPHQNKDGILGFDQIDHVINTLREDPMSRRAVISIYDPGADVPAGKDVPCNDFLQFQIREGRLHVTVTVRSNDLMWGWSGINAFEWSTLQEIVASLLDVVVGTLTFNIGNLHLYDVHWKRADKIGQPEPYGFFRNIPFNPYGIITSLTQVDIMLDRWFIWEDMCRRGEATADLLDDWEEPLFKAWATAIAYYWQRDDHWYASLDGTALQEAMRLTPASVLPEPVRKPSEAPAVVLGVAGQPPLFEDPQTAFLKFVMKLHATKHKSYGDSWKKRGEKMSIIPNIARKIDRLGVGDEYDSSADTVIDLWVYLAKYLSWLQGSPTSGPEDVNPILTRALLGDGGTAITPNWEIEIPVRFNVYVNEIDHMTEYRKREEIWWLLRLVTPIALSLWSDEQDEYRPDLGVF